MNELAMPKLIPGVLCTMALAFFQGVAMAQAVLPDTMKQRTLACVACHGEDGRATSEGFFPRIAGKPAGYLYNQLVNFRDGRRQNAHMTYMVGYLSDPYLKEMAEYFSKLQPPYSAPQSHNASAETLEQGRALVLKGDPLRNIPACIACHGQKLKGVQPAIPSLVGLPRDYLNSQFGAWKSGLRKAASPDCMAQISKQLSPAEIGAVTTWLAAQPIPADMTAEPAGSVQLPVSCGSVPR